MNSLLIRENWSNFVNRLSVDEKNAFINMGLRFYNAQRSGDTALIRRIYKEYLDMVLSYEKKEGVQIIKSPDGSYVTALSAVAGIIEKYIEQEKERWKPERHTVSFSSVESANEWLCKQSSIEVESLNVQTHSRYGIGSRIAVVDSVKIDYTDYKKQVGHTYGMCTESASTVFISADTDRFKEKWHNKHPGLEIVLVSYVSRVRADRGSISWVTGFGLSRVEYRNYFIIYRKQKSQYEENIKKA